MHLSGLEFLFVSLNDILPKQLIDTIWIYDEKKKYINKTNFQVRDFLYTLNSYIS